MGKEEGREELVTSLSEHQSSLGVNQVQLQVDSVTVNLQRCQR